MVAKLSNILYVVKQNLPISDNNFIGIFVYGSQNYQLDSEESDVDTILIVRSADESKQEIVLRVGKVKVYSLKHFIYRLKRGDLECYEILYTPHRIINPLYTERMEDFIKEFSICMNYERIKYSLYLKLDEHLSHTLWVIRNDEKARYNKKRFYWAIRVCNQLKRIDDGESFESSLVYRSLWPYDLRKIKTITDYLSIKDFNTVYKRLVDFTQTRSCSSISTSSEENQCLSNFYINMFEAIEHNGGDAS